MWDFVKSIPTWGWFDIAFTFIVLVGVAGESKRIAHWLAGFSIDKTTLGWKMLTDCKAETIHKYAEWFVIVGVAGEVLCLAFSLNEDFKLNKQAKDEALKVEELRKLNDEFAEQAEPMSVGNQEEFIKAVGAPPNVIVGITNAPEDAKAAMTARSLVFLLRQAGWPVSDGTDKQKTGIAIEVNAPTTDWKNKAVETAKFLQKTLTDRHLPAVVVSNSVVPIGARETMVVIDVHERPEPKLYEEMIDEAHEQEAFAALSRFSDEHQNPDQNDRNEIKRLFDSWQTAEVTFATRIVKNNSESLPTNGVKTIIGDGIEVVVSNGVLSSVFRNPWLITISNGVALKPTFVVQKPQN